MRASPYISGAAQCPKPVTGGETQGRLVAAVLHGVLETDGREPVRGEKGLELIMERK